MTEELISLISLIHPLSLLFEKPSLKTDKCGVYVSWTEKSSNILSMASGTRILFLLPINQSKKAF